MAKKTDMVYIEGKPWFSSKTVWAAFADIISSLGLIMAGQSSLALQLQTAWIPLILVFIRLGANKKITWK